jgi:hypothetical protein
MVKVGLVLLSLCDLYLYSLTGMRIAFRQKTESKPRVSTYLGDFMAPTDTVIGPRFPHTHHDLKVGCARNG